MSKKFLLPLLIIFLGTFLRFYRIDQRFVFTFDEEYQSTLAQTIVKDFHIIWIGVSAANLGFYLGPLWTYFTALWQYLSHGDPLITAYVAASIGVLTIIMVYLTGKSLFSRKTALIASLLYATLPLYVFYDQKYWNPSLMPILSLTILLSLSKRWWPLFFLSYGLVFHTHLSLFPAIVPAAYLIFTNTKTVLSKRFFVGIGIFIVMLSPLIVFDYVHKYSNISTPLRIHEITQNPSTRISPAYKLESLFGVLSRLVYLAPGKETADEVLFACSQTPKLIKFPVDSFSTWTQPSTIISAVVFSGLAYFFTRKTTWTNPKSKLLSILVLSIGTSYILFPGNAFEYYLLSIFPLVLFIPGILTQDSSAKVKRFLYIAVTALSIIGIITVVSDKDSFGVSTKKRLIIQVMNSIKNQPYILEEKGGCHRWSSWRYLFSVYGQPPQVSSVDRQLGWLYPDQINKDKPVYKVIVTETRYPIDFNIKGSEMIKEGGFAAYVSRN